MLSCCEGPGSSNSSIRCCSSGSWHLKTLLLLEAKGFGRLPQRGRLLSSSDRDPVLHHSGIDGPDPGLGSLDYDLDELHHLMMSLRWRRSLRPCPSSVVCGCHWLLFLLLMFPLLQLGQCALRSASQWPGPRWCSKNLGGKQDQYALKWFLQCTSTFNIIFRFLSRQFHLQEIHKKQSSIFWTAEFKTAQNVPAFYKRRKLSCISVERNTQDFMRFAVGHISGLEHSFASHRNPPRSLYHMPNFPSATISFPIPIGEKKERRGGTRQNIFRALFFIDL